jgi:hypothetical protein
VPAEQADNAKHKNFPSKSGECLRDARARIPGAITDESGCRRSGLAQPHARAAPFDCMLIAVALALLTATLDVKRDIATVAHAIWVCPPT